MALGLRLRPGRMERDSLIERLGLQLIPGGCCQWGPTLLASDLLLGGPHPKGISDQALLAGLSHALRDRQCARLVLLGRLFAKSADPHGDLPGLLVSWRSEILEADIIWVFPEPLTKWTGILEFLEVKPAPSGSMLGEAELLSSPLALSGLRHPTFIGGSAPKSEAASGKNCLMGWTSSECLILPSLGGKAKTASAPKGLDLSPVFWPGVPAFEDDP